MTNRVCFKCCNSILMNFIDCTANSVFIQSEPKSLDMNNFCHIRKAESSVFY